MRRSQSEPPLWHRTGSAEHRPVLLTLTLWQGPAWVRSCTPSRNRLDRAGVGSGAAALRAIGLFRPARIHPGSRYRLYEQSQLAQLNQIAALRDLRCSLADITRVANAPDDVGLLHRLLLDRRAAVERALQLDGERLRRIESRLRIVEGIQTAPSPQIAVKSVPP